MLSVRPAKPCDANAIATIHVDTWKKTYKGLVPQSFLDTLDVHEKSKFWAEKLGNQDKNFHCYVAQAENNVIGFSCGGPNRTKGTSYKGELYAIYVSKKKQKEGVGKMLFQKTVSRLAEDGFDSMLIWVIEKNPSIGFYQSMGGRKVEMKEDDIGGAPVTEIGFGWKPLPKAF